jgi:hypothetical protein
MRRRVVSGFVLAAFVIVIAGCEKKVREPDPEVLPAQVEEVDETE